MPNPFEPVSVWIVFQNTERGRVARRLRRGFQHCYALMHDDKCWITFDPTGNGHEIMVHHHLPPSYDLPLWTRQHFPDTTVVHTLSHLPMPFTLNLMSCVGNMKRILGIRAPFVWTPWQLFVHIMKKTDRAEAMRVNLLMTPFDKLVEKANGS